MEYSVDWKLMAARVVSELGTLDLASSLQEDLKSKKVVIIMSSLLENSVSGMSLEELRLKVSKFLIKKELNIDKKYIREILGNLISRGFVRKDKGKFGKYYPNLKLKDNYFLESSIYSGEIAAFFDQNRIFVTGNPPWNTNCRNLEDFKQLIPAFSTRLGAIMTYFLIQSMNISNKIIAGGNSKAEKDFLVKKWVKDIFSHIAVDILESFRFTIQDPLVAGDERETSLNIDVEDLREDVTIDDLSGVIPAYTLGDKVISDLETAFYASYPILFPYLDKMQSEIPQLTKMMKLKLECAHNYKLMLGPDGKETYEVCTICNDITVVDIA